MKKQREPARRNPIARVASKMPNKVVQDKHALVREKYKAVEKALDDYYAAVDSIEDYEE